MGHIDNYTHEEIIVEVDKRYINNTIEEYGVHPNPNQNFGLALRIEIPQLITLKYGKHKCQLFAEPYDTLLIEFDASTFPENLTFGGRAQDNNYLWQEFNQQFPKDDNVFKYRQYRKGVYYYKIHEEEDARMRDKAPDDYRAYLRNAYEQKQALFSLYANAPDKRITQEFADFIQAEIIYEQLLQLLTYGDVYRGRYRLEDSFFEFVDSSLLLNDLFLGSETYRNYLYAWVNFQIRRENKAGNPYIHQYEYAKENLEERSKYFTLAQIVALALRKNAPADVLPIYEDFIKDNPYFELDRVVLDPFQKANQFAAGSPAPDFELQDLQGNLVKLSDFKGKVVYLDFWASWCRPCMEKLKKMKDFEPNFKDKEVVFLHLSIDKNPEIWQQTVAEKQLSGNHLFVNPYESNIIEDYEVLSVPKFFLITAAGNFAYTPTSFDSEELALAIQRLLNQ